jgi:hypothetical protein
VCRYSTFRSLGTPLVDCQAELHDIHQTNDVTLPKRGSTYPSHKKAVLQLRIERGGTGLASVALVSTEKRLALARRSPSSIRVVRTVSPLREEYRCHQSTRPVTRRARPTMGPTTIPVKTRLALVTMSGIDIFGMRAENGVRWWWLVVKKQA